MKVDRLTKGTVILSSQDYFTTVKGRTVFYVMLSSSQDPMYGYFVDSLGSITRRLTDLNAWSTCSFL